MKSYDDVITRLGTYMFHSYMGGSSKYYHTLDQVELISFIFDVTTIRVYDDAEVVFNEHFKDQRKFGQLRK